MVAWRRYAPLAVLLAAAALAAVSASVFVYYPVTASVSYTNPPIVLQGGTNANQTDLSGSISVTLGANKTSAQITLHPTYQTTWYHDVLRVVNNAASTYYVMLKLGGGLQSVTGNVKIIVYDSAGNQVATIDTSTNALTTGWITLNAGDYLVIDVVFTVNEGQQISGKTDTLTLNVIYSTQNTESPPA